MKSYGRKKNIILLLVVSVMLVMSGCSGDKNAADIETESKSEAATTVETLQETEAQVAEGSTLVVGTFNIDVKAKEYVTPEQKQIMEDYGVDIFGIQEVDRNITRFDIEVYDPLTDFQQDPYTDSYFGLSIAKGDGQYGNAIISKYALSDTSVTQLYGVEEAPEDVQAQYFEIYENYDASSEEGAASMMLVWGEGGLVSQGAIEPRSYSRAVIEKDGKKIAFYTTHLSVESQEIRTKQLEQLRDALDTDEAEYRIVVVILIQMAVPTNIMYLPTLDINWQMEIMVSGWKR